MKKRESKFELLRTISMIFIILHHYAIHGGLITIDEFGINKCIGVFIYISGKVAVNIFMLISGYFLINSDFKISKLIKLVLEILFYTILIFIIDSIITKTFYLEKLIISLFPITRQSYWFLTFYVSTYCLSPFINKFLTSIKKEKFIILIFILLILFFILPTVLEENMYMGYFQWYIFIYMLGAYIKLYDIKFINKKRLKTYIIFSYSVFYAICLVIVYFIKNSLDILEVIIDINHIFAFSESILIFIFFKNLNLKKSEIINFIGKSSIAVYLIHDNILIRNFLWENIFRTKDFYYANSIILILHIMFCCICIYLSGVLLEIFRINFIEKKIKFNKNNKILFFIDEKMKL